MTVAAVLVLAAAAYLLVRVLLRLAPMTMAIIAALLLAALIGPLTERFKRWGLPATVAALSGVIGLLALLAGVSYLIGRRATSELDDLRAQVVEGLDRLRQSALDTLPGIDDRRLDEITAAAADAARRALPSPVAGATSAAEFLASALLAVFLLFFFLRDGEQMWCWLVRLIRSPRAERVDRAGRSGWHTLSAYTHGTAAVAAVDAIGIGAALFVLKVPLALSLAVLTFVSAFVPIVGATVAGAAAALVTLVTNGPRDALIVIAAVVIVQQLEGNLLQPLVMRRAIRLHPVVTLLAVTAGTLAAGVAGALIAVPICAVVYHATLGYRSDRLEEEPPHDTDARGPDDEHAPAGDRPGESETAPSPEHRVTQAHAGQAASRGRV
ncbi:AI-2E family transporter [Actinoplanes sp. NPDC049316]|uniref:AI-2E family transporter n=1 Tax=Actinoplanes sp. NPDC049316 TaxID=3154727 RepID=UPI00342CFCB5